MVLLKLKINDKTYMSGKITTYMTKEALRIQREALTVGERAMKLESGDVEGAAELFDDIYELSDRKTWLLCEVYGDQFTPDEVERGLTPDEVDIAINMIISGASGVIEKNSPRGPRQKPGSPQTKKR